MPYIPEDQRDTLSGVVEALRLNKPQTAGELQYLIASMIHLYLTEKGGGARYQDMNDVMGALTGAQQEFYRCVVAPYEEVKLLENGGVYGSYEGSKSY